MTAQRWFRVLMVLAPLLAARLSDAQVLTGTLSGTVKDESDGVLPTVSVRLSSPALISGPISLVTNERGQFRARTLAAFRGDEPLLRSLLDSGRRVLAGMLLLVPGILTDAVALVLLLLPINQRGGFGPEPVTASRSSYPDRRSFEGEYRRLE